MWALVVVVLLVAIVLFVLRGSPELARLEVRDGRLALVSGRMPPRLFDDFEDIVRRSSIAHADVRFVLDGGRPRVVAVGLTDDAAQQLRNVSGSYEAAQFRAGRKARG